MEPFGGFGKTLILLGAVLMVLGVVFVLAPKIPFLGKTARRHSPEGQELELFLPGSDLHRDQHRADAAPEPFFEKNDLARYFQPPPPFTYTVSAVMNAHASEHMNNTSSPISSGVPKRPIGIWLRIDSLSSSEETS